MVYSTVVKSGAFISALLAVSVIGVSSWALASTFLHESHSQVTDYKNDVINNDTSTTISLPITTETGMTSTPELKSFSLTPMSGMEKYWDNKSKKFRSVIQVCTGTSVFAGLLQLSVSWMVICANAKNIGDRVKMWQLANFMIFLLIIVCILVPMTFNTEQDNFLGTTSFWRQMKKKFVNLSMDKLDNQTVLDIFMNDLNCYSIILGINDLFLLLLLTLTCCCLRCTNHPYQAV